MSRPFYLTTTLPYVNADPHIGFALEIVQADIIVRYRKLCGDEVFFNTGTDEHGLKIYRNALLEGKDPQAYADEYVQRFQSLKETLNLYPDIHFIRTTDPHHKAAAQELWRLCLAKGDIYKKIYKGLYCVGDEAFIKETELVNGKCPNHPTMEPIEIEEENYFFRLSAYQDKLLAYLGHESVIVPEWRRQEAIQFVNSGLEDFSISRVREKMPWGVSVPDDETQVMYVWFDALTSYISTLGWPEDTVGNFKKYWEEGETLQLAGKDQVRFQSIMWQAMLMSAGLSTTKKVLYHGFITSGGQKMSKSLGNVIDPVAIVKEYGTDALRYFLARHIQPFDDSDFTMEKFKDAYNADLADGLGNNVARIMQLAERNLPQPVFTSPEQLHDIRYPESFIRALSNFDLSAAINLLWTQIPTNNIEAVEKISGTDMRITYAVNANFSVSSVSGTVQVDKPWAMKEDNQRVGLIIKEVQQLAALAKAIEPFMPETSKKIIDAIIVNKKPENLFPRKD